MAKQMSDTKKEFVQKYMLDDYSRAIPARVLEGKKPVLGEYCEPLDTAYKKKHEEGDSSDSDSGYALPEDSLSVKKPVALPRNPSDVADGDVYELAQQAMDGDDNRPPRQSRQKTNETSPRKPSPKPRSSQTKKQKSMDATSAVSHKNEKLKLPNHQSFHGRETTGSSQLHDQSSIPGDPAHPANFQPERRRPSKKVVEIEYEMAAAIRPTKPDVHSSSNSLQQPAAQPPVVEALYEEPWDLKVKRLKQEEEEKKLKKLNKVSVQSKPLQPNAKMPVYEEAWDSVAQQRKLEEKLVFARSMSQVSQTSETDIFHDAVDSMAVPSFDGRGAAGPVLNPQTPSKSKAEPPPAYEDAWDLKTNILDQKIRQMQLQASATYEEPWDSGKRKEQFQAKLMRSCGSSPHHEKLRQRSSSEAYEQTWEGDESKPNVHRGKYHSVDDSKARAKAKGCNVGQRINPMIPLVNQNWYHGNISRDDAQKMLCVCKEGSYIVRISSDRKSYSLSIKSAEQYIHVQIEQILCDDGSVHFILGKNSKEFSSIPQMIDYYTHHRVPLKGAEHITLLYPVECKWS